jgi:signal transduction histidine kinase/CheY-like chemotaxis protein
MTTLPAQSSAHKVMLSDLRRELLEWLLVPTVLASFYTLLVIVILLDIWANMGRQILVDQVTFAWIAIGAALGVLGTCRVAYRLQKHRPRLAAYVYVGGLAVIAYVLSWIWFNPLSMVLLPAIILLGIAVLSLRSTLALAVVTSLVIVLTATVQSQFIPDAVAPLAAVWLTTLTAWVSIRNQIRATEWALSSYRQAEKKTEEARKHRGELMRVYKSLDEAYHQLERFTVQLAKAREEAEQALRVKQQFVANVSHELRTPLNIIIGFSETIVLSPEAYGVKAIPRQLMGDINRIYRSARHLKSLIDDVLDLSKIDAHQMPLLAEPSSLTQIVCDATEMIESIVKRRGLKLIVNLPDSLPPIFLDRLRVRQVLLNLLTNAVRFTAEGEITVSVQPCAEAVQVTVADTGHGIAPEDMARVFEEFRQLDASLNKRYDGTGLGLALSRRFIEMHGGRLWAESELGQGSRFSFTLPLRHKAGPPAPTGSKYLPVSDHVKARVGRTVLVTAKEPMSGNLLKRHLHGYQVKSVSAQDLSAAIATYLPHAVITSDLPSTVNGQGGDGSGQIDPAAMKVPVISCPLPDPERLSRVLGVDHYLVKPISRDYLLTVLEGYGDQVNHILIIDDDVQLIELMSRFVKAAPRSYRVDVACGGEEGWDRMKAHPPDLVLLDLMMPDLDGLTILKFMKADDRLQNVPVIMITARDLPQSEIQLPGQNKINIQVPSGFTITESLTCLQAILNTLPPPDFTAGSASGPVEIQPRRPAS